MSQTPPPFSASSSYSGLTAAVPRPAIPQGGPDGDGEDGAASLGVSQGAGKAGFLIFQFRAFYAEVRALFNEARVTRDPASAPSFSTMVTAAQDGGAPAGSSPQVPGATPGAPAQPAGNGDVPPVLAAKLSAPAGAADPLATQGQSPVEVAAGSEEAASSVPHPVLGVEEMVRRLSHHLEVGAGEAARLGGAYGVALYNEAKYAMAALADETFLHQGLWAGREAWRDSLVETRLFGTSIAGERLFQRMDALLVHGDPVHTELASVYLMCLTLGFKGRYRGTNEAVLEDYRRRLRDFIGRRLQPVTPDKPIFAGAYAHTLDDVRERFLPLVRLWVWALLLFLLCYGLVSHGLWLWMTDAVRTIIGRG